MINGKKLIVVMPAYNASQTLKKTYNDLPHEIIDEVILVDDGSSDDTIEVARELGISTIIRHRQNQGYGGNQKTCYTIALRHDAEIVVMIHPDYQYSPRLCGAMAWMIASGEYDMALASRILGAKARSGGMPLWRYLANRGLTFVENLLLGSKLSEYHTGYRAFTRELLLALPLHENTDDFAFDNQIIVQGIYFGFRIGEISCPARYEPDSSSINFWRSVKYGFGVLEAAIAYRFAVWGIYRSRLFLESGGRLGLEANDGDNANIIVVSHCGKTLTDPAQ